MMKQPSYTEDFALLEAMRSGNSGAMTDIYRRYHDPLYLYALKSLGQTDLAKDLVQEIFLSLWERRMELQIRGSFQAYLFQAVRFKCIDHLRSVKNQQQSLDQFQQYLDEGYDSVGEQLEEQELFTKLQQILQSLPGKMRQIFWMRQDNIPDEQIAEQLGISVKTVRNLMSQTAQKVRRRLESYFFSLFFA